MYNRVLVLPVPMETMIIGIADDPAVVVVVKPPEDVEVYARNHRRYKSMIQLEVVEKRRRRS